MFAIGEYPMVSLSEARQKCEDARKLVKQGQSPTHSGVTMTRAAMYISLTLRSCARLYVRPWTIHRSTSPCRHMPTGQ
ncbi:Arm DNA-binding domain-containing protein [Rugamonas brunnea]|uniref:Arm DNA-binding domain-containing protein n=1 Tax=Rugamonas brunnea TaxID=2758569 RepID=UPI002106CAF4|nr:Arm DNA-binding domain-containing protein [Rugamonas brunnea]